MGKILNSRNQGLTPEDDHSSHHRSIEMDADGLGDELPDYPSAVMDHGQPSPPDDEAIAGMDYEQGPVYGPMAEPVGGGQTWDWSRIDGRFRPHNNSDADEDMFGDKNSSNESTRVAGSPGSSVAALMDDTHDTAHFSDMNQDEHLARSMRESAPPPHNDYEPVPVDPMLGDDDDELPVVELHHGDGAGDFNIKQVPK